MIPASHILTTPEPWAGTWQIASSTPEMLEIRGATVLYDFESTTDNQRTIRLLEGSSLVYFALYSGKSCSNIRFEIIGKAALQVRVWVFWGTESPLHVRLETVVQASGSDAHIEILGLAFEGGHIDIDGILSIEQGLSEVVGAIRESNVFLWQTGSIRGIPTLKVRSDDVKASHSCTVEQLSDEHRFYLEGRGLSAEAAKRTLLEGKLAQLYVGLPTALFEQVGSVFAHCFDHV